MIELVRNNNPLVTVTIPVRSWHRNMFNRAINCFKSQTYKRLELIVIEDGPTTNVDLVMGIERLKYFSMPFGNLAQKRNLAAFMASGEYICHFDDDDWSGPNRIKDQLSYFNENLDLVGYGRTMWYDEVKKEARLYTGSPWGASIMYKRDYVLANPFNITMNVAEDAPFIAAARKVIIDAGDNMIAVQHSDNTPRTYEDINAWTRISKLSLPSLFYSAIDKPLNQVV